jgi:hypothetical protein
MFTLKFSVIFALIGALTGHFFTSLYYKNEISKIDLMQAHVQNTALELASKIEQVGNQVALELEVKNVQTKQKLDKTMSDNRRLVSELGGLRDPYTTNKYDCKMPESTSDSKDETDGNKLSNELTEFLLAESRRADEAANYAMTCYELFESNPSTN